MGNDLADRRAALHAAIDDDQPGAANDAAWPPLDPADPRWQALADEIGAAAARLHPSVGDPALIHPDAAGAALVDRRCRLRGSDARFRERIGEPAFSADCRRLVARARAGKPAMGLLTALDGRVAPMFARALVAAGPWDALAAGLGDARMAGKPVLLIAFAPLRPSTLARRASAVLGLTPLEAKLAETLLEAPKLAAAAELIGVSRKTAGEALARAMLKAGVRKPSDLARRLTELDR